MRINLWILLGVLLLSHAGVNTQGLYGDAQDDLRILCLAMALPGRHNGPNPDEFLSTWNALLAKGGAKFLDTADHAPQLRTAKERCNRSTTHIDKFCGFLELSDMGKLVHQDVQQLHQSLVGSGSPANSWWYHMHYIAAWFQHPRMKELQCSPNFNYLWLFMAKLSKLESYDTVLRMKFVFDADNAKGLRQEIRKHCSIYQETVKPICRLITWTKTADKVGKLLNYVGRSNWAQPPAQNALVLKDALKDAIRLHFYGVKLLFQKLNPGDDAGEFLSTTEREIKNWIKRVVFYIYDTLKNDMTAELAKVVELLPEDYELPCDLTADFPSLDRCICTFKSTITPLKPYVSNYLTRKQSKGAIVRKMISYKEINYEEYLNQKRLERIKQITEITQHDLISVAKHLESTITKGFGGLQSYFQTMAKFDHAKAKADMEYVSSTIDKYKGAYGRLSNGLTSKLKILIPLAITATTADLVASAVKLVVSVAGNCNPIAWITGEADPNELVERAEDLARKAVQVAKSSALINALNVLAGKAKIYIGKMRDNDNFWKSVSNVIKKLTVNTTTSEFEKQKDYFLNEYNNYKPAATKEDLVGVTEAWKDVVDEVCTIIDETEGIYSSAIKGGLAIARVCPNAKIDAEKLGVVLEEIYDLQFDLIDAMVDYMRALTSFKAAEVITSDFSSAITKLAGNPNIYSELELLAGFSMTCYKISIITAIESYCDILEYREGKRPNMCNGLGTTITGILSRVPTTCATSTSEQFRFVPTKPSKTGDTAFLNAKDLYAGKTVPFRIQDSQWLVDRKWLLETERNDVVFVQRFEIFLPTITEGTTKWTKVKVTATAGRTNQLRSPSGTNYVLNPPRTLEYDYEEGGGTCRLRKIENPYKHMACKQMPDICPLTSDASYTGIYDIYPSIYAQFDIRLHGYSHLTVPDTDFSIRVGLKLCKIRMTSSPLVRNVEPNSNNIITRLLRILENEQEEKDEEQRSVSVENCCQGNQYRSHATRTCTICPPGSKERYGGLFCGNITRIEWAPVVDSTTKYFTFEEAKATCEKAGTTIASPSDMAEAVSLGYDSCACGWLSDGSVMAPKPSAKCDASNKEDTTTCNARQKWDVYCLNIF